MARSRSRSRSRGGRVGLAERRRYRQLFNRLGGFRRRGGVIDLNRAAGMGAATFGVLANRRVRAAYQFAKELYKDWLVEKKSPLSNNKSRKTKVIVHHAYPEPSKRKYSKKKKYYKSYNGGI